MANSPEHKRLVTERQALIELVLEPLGSLQQLQQDIRSDRSLAELRHALFFSWQCGYHARIRDEHVLNGTRPDPPVITDEEYTGIGKAERAKQARERRARLKKERLADTRAWGPLRRIP